MQNDQTNFQINSVKLGPIFTLMIIFRDCHLLCINTKYVSCSCRKHDLAHTYKAELLVENCSFFRSSWLVAYPRELHLYMRPDCFWAKNVGVCAWRHQCSSFSEITKRKGYSWAQCQRVTVVSSHSQCGCQVQTMSNILTVFTSIKVSHWFSPGDIWHC